MPEVDPLVFSYSHLADFPRAADALHTLKKVASLVKPLMRARGWRVGELTEFYPSQQNLLGLNVDRGKRICLRLRYPGDRNQFLPLEQVADTMLHELAHNVHGPHDAKFHALWNQLRDEHLSLTLKGYTGEGFLSEGHQLGGRTMPMDEARRLARNAAERRRTLGAGSGQRLGGSVPRPGQDIRRVIGDAVEQRNRTLRGCANDNQTQDEIIEIADTATRNGFRTKAEEDAANDAAIAQALWEIVQEEEMAKKGTTYVPPSTISSTSGDSRTSKGRGQGSRVVTQPSTSRSSPRRDKELSNTWTCGVCTLNNPLIYLCCDACGTERGEKPTPKQRTVIDLTGPDRGGANRGVQSASASKAKESRQAPSQPKASSASPTWTCHFCGRVRESQWWSCDLCGTIKLSSN
ncbi:WLM-domain-containing protein [Xylaria cf. heliscus]|nr:WLM-domain-containing protein [Xylaria cf. heliscus]